jgi:hypothetical protein
MKKIFFIFIFFFAYVYSFSQQLVCNSKGNIKNKITNERISSAEMRGLLKDYPKIMNQYNDGRIKKTIGNVMFIGGIGMVTTDLIVGLTSATKYPTKLTNIGVATTLISIPIKIGFLKKIRGAVSDYNTARYTGNITYKSEIMVNTNGVGFRINF